MIKYTKFLFFLLLITSNIVRAEEQNNLFSQESDIVKYEANNIYFSSQKINYNFKENLIKATGNVNIRTSKENITADTLFYDIEKELLYARGNVVIQTSSENIIYSDRVTLDISFHNALIQYLKLEFSKSVVIAEEMRKSDEQNQFKNMLFTSCNILNDRKPIWSISSTNGFYNEETDSISLTNMWVNINEVPIFWLPYFSFSNLDFKRKSGLLIPSYINNSLYGNGIILPLYIPINDHQDLTLYAHTFINSRPLILLNYEGYVKNGSFKSSFSYVSPQNTNNSIDKKHRWHSFFNLKNNISENWRSEINIEELSDISYPRMYNLSMKDESDSFYRTQAQLEGFFYDSYFYTNISRYENINPLFKKSNLLLKNSVHASYNHWYNLQDLGSIDIFVSNDNLLTQKNETLSRVFGKASYDYFIPTNFGNYSFDILTQGAFYSNILNNTEEIKLDDHFYSSVASSATFEFPLVTYFRNNTYSVTQISQLLYVNSISPNNNAFLQRSYSINANNLFNIHNSQGYDHLDNGLSLQYALQFNMINNNNQINKLFLGQRLSFLENNYNILDNTNSYTTSDYFASLSVFLFKDLNLGYTGIIDEDLNAVETYLNINYSSELLYLGATFNEYRRINSELLGISKVSDLYLEGTFNISPTFKLSANSTLDTQDSTMIGVKTLNLEFIWANECLEFIIYNKNDFYDNIVADSWGFRIFIKSISNVEFTL